MIRTIKHIGIIVGNIELGLIFYKEILGLKVVSQVRLEGKDITELLNYGSYNIDVTCIKMAAEKENVLLELYYFHNPEVPNYNSLRHICFAVENLNELVIKLKKEGIEILSEPKILYGYNIVFIRDYWGNLIELSEELK